MTTAEIFKYLQRIHTVIMATTDDDGRPVTCAIDIMDSDGQGLYFLTAKGKSFYDRLIARPFVALTAVSGNGTLNSVAVSVCGDVRREDDNCLARMIKKNDYMLRIYPTQSSRTALAAFCLYRGVAEWFDLSARPIERFTLAFGGAESAPGGYTVGPGCISCGACLASCPQDCIKIDESGAHIAGEHCLRCGNCMSACPVGAVRRE